MAALSGYFAMAQSELPPVDKSPMDMSYYPVDYPVLKISDKVADSPAARIIYGRPQKNGRPIFGNLVEYGQVWRLGANEATERAAEGQGEAGSPSPPPTA